MQHQVAHRPARQAEQAQQPVLHLGPLGQQGEVALAPQQRLEPVDELDRRVQRAALLAHRLGRARDQVREAHLALVAQHSDLRVLAQRRDARRAARPAGRRGRPRRRSAAASGRSCGSRCRRRSTRAAVVQQRDRTRCATDSRATPSRSSIAQVPPSARVAEAARRSSRGRRRGSAARASAGRRGTGCGARSGAARCRRRPDARRSRAASVRRRRACRAPSASSACGSRGTGRRARPAAAGR